MHCHVQHVRKHNFTQRPGCTDVFQSLSVKTTLVAHNISAITKLKTSLTEIIHAHFKLDSDLFTSVYLVNHVIRVCSLLEKKKIITHKKASRRNLNFQDSRQLDLFTSPYRIYSHISVYLEIFWSRCVYKWGGSLFTISIDVRAQPNVKPKPHSINTVQTHSVLSIFCSKRHPSG